MKQTDITNNLKINLPSDFNYKSFNDFIFSNDLKLMGKLLHRFQFYEKVKDLPGDIVEIGVFKGSGMASFLKFIQIYNPNSNKKVIGFDIFDCEEAKNILDKDSEVDKKTMTLVYDRVDKDELSLEAVHGRIKQTEISDEKFILVKGDVEETLKQFIDRNPGFRASLIYIDVDIERPTYLALKYLWDRLLPGGYVLFDEYEYHKFSESKGVDTFLKERNLPYEVKSTNWIAPTAYLQKNNY